MPSYTAEQMQTMAYGLLGEAESKGMAGMTAVAHVVRNRADSPVFSADGNAYDVMLRPGQFSTFNDPSAGGNQAQVQARNPVGSARYEQALKIVQTVIAADVPPADPTGDAVYYHTSGIKPYWASSALTSYGTINDGAHIFYAREPQQVSFNAAATAIDEVFSPPMPIDRPKMPVVSVRGGDFGEPQIIDLTGGGTVAGQSFAPSPFTTPRKGEITSIVMHHTAGPTLTSALNAAGKTGATFYIDRDGTIYQYAQEGNRVVNIQAPGSPFRTDFGEYTAGISNDTTLGIEIVGAFGGKDDITPAQIDAAARLAAHLSQKFSIPADHIVGHGELQGGAGGNRLSWEGLRAAQAARDLIANGGIGFAFADMRTGEPQSPLDKAAYWGIEPVESAIEVTPILEWNEDDLADPYVQITGPQMDTPFDRGTGAFMLPEDVTEANVDVYGDPVGLAAIDMAMAAAHQFATPAFDVADFYTGILPSAAGLDFIPTDVNGLTQYKGFVFGTDGRIVLDPQVPGATPIERAPLAGVRVPPPQSPIERAPAAGVRVPPPQSGIERAPQAGMQRPVPSSPIERDPRAGFTPVPQSSIERDPRAGFRPTLADRTNVQPLRPPVPQSQIERIPPSSYQGLPVGQDGRIIVGQREPVQGLRLPVPGRLIERSPEQRIDDAVKDSRSGSYAGQEATSIVTRKIVSNPSSRGSTTPTGSSISPSQRLAIAATAASTTKAVTKPSTPVPQSTIERIPVKTTTSSSSGSSSKPKPPVSGLSLPKTPVPQSTIERAPVTTTISVKVPVTTKITVPQSQIERAPAATAPAPKPVTKLPPPTQTIDPAMRNAISAVPAVPPKATVPVTITPAAPVVPVPAGPVAPAPAPPPVVVPPKVVTVTTYTTKKITKTVTPPKPKVTYKGTATGNEYVVGQRYQSEDGSRVIEVMPDGSFRDVKTGKITQGSKKVVDTRKRSPSESYKKDQLGNRDMRQTRKAGPISSY